MAYYGKKKQSIFIPEDGFITFYVDKETRGKLERYMQFQPPTTSLPVVVRELVCLGLSAAPEDSAIHMTRLRVLKSATHLVYKRLAQTFKELGLDLKELSLAHADEAEPLTGWEVDE